MKLFFWPLTLFYLLISLAVPAAETDQAKETVGRVFDFTKADDQAQFLSRYPQHKQSGRVSDFIIALSRDGVLEDDQARATVVAFLAQLFRQERQSIGLWYDAWLRGMPPRHLKVIHSALLYSRTSEADALMLRLFGDRYRQQKTEVQKILEMPIDSVLTLPMLWGFYYATESETALRRVVLCFRLNAAPKQLDGLEVPEGFTPYYQVLPDLAFETLLNGAREHPPVRDTLESFLEQAAAGETPVDEFLTNEEKAGIERVLAALEEK